MITNMPAIPPERIFDYTVADFSPGLHEEGPDGLLPIGAASDVQNCDVSNGNLKNAPGIEEYCLPVDEAVHTLMVVYIYASPRILCGAGENIYELVQGEQPSVLQTGFSGQHFHHVAYQKDMTDLLFFGNSQDGLWQWDGQTFTHLTNAPCPNALELHKERLYLLPDNDPIGVQCSDDLNPDVWTQTLTTGALIRIPTWDGTRCVGLKGVGDEMIIAKERSLWRIWGTQPDNFQLSCVFSSRGSIARRSMVSCDRGMAFLSQDGVYLFDGVNSHKLGGDHIKKTLSKFNTAQVDKVCATYFDNKYFLSMAINQGEENNVVCIYDFALGAWQMRFGLCITDFMQMDGKLVVADALGRIGIYGIGHLVFGEEQYSYWMSPMRGFESPQWAKKLKTVWLHAKGSGYLVLQWQMDNHEWCGKQITLTQEMTLHKIPLHGSCKVLRFGFFTWGAQFEVARMQWDFIPQEIMGV